MLVDPNKTDLTDEMNKAKAAGADVVMPWSAATGLLGRLLNARGDMGWDVPVVGHPRADGAQIRKLLNKPEYWENTFAAGLQSTTYGPTASFLHATQALVDKIAASSAAARSTSLFWWVALGYDSVKIIEHAVKTGRLDRPGSDPEGAREHDGPRRRLRHLQWGASERNGFPGRQMAIDVANTFKDGSFKPAPRSSPRPPRDAPRRHAYRHRLPASRSAAVCAATRWSTT